MQNDPDLLEKNIKLGNENNNDILNIKKQISDEMDLIMKNNTNQHKYEDEIKYLESLRNIIANKKMIL